MLLHTERKLHRQGWGALHGARIFRVDRHPSTNRVALTWYDVMSMGLAMHVLSDNGAFGVALQNLANQCELTRAQLDNMQPSDGLAPRALGEDPLLPEPQWPDYQFYGFGIACENWKTGHEQTLVGRKTGQAFARDRTLHLYPDRIEGRFLYFCARDGLSWVARRSHGAGPFAYCWRPGDSDYVHVGLVMNALSRMTNCNTGARDVPIIPLVTTIEKPASGPE